MVRGYSSLPYRLAALVLVCVYIGAFDFWRALVGGLGPGRAAILPVALTGVAALAILALALWRGQRSPKVRPRAVALGLVLAAVALFLSDPAFPAKRIHVLEYAILALVVGRALMPEIGGRMLLGAAALATAVLGSHDELVQGLLAERTFGLRDFAIDAVSAVAGITVGYGLGLFGTERPDASDRLDAVETFALAILAAGWLALVMAMPALVDLPMPLWPVVPVLAGLLAWAIGCAGAPATGARRTLATLTFLMAATAIEPILAHAVPLAFH